MERPKPEITVIISSYGDRALIPKKLEEIRAQTAFERAEFIFIEPDSPERERELIEPFCRKHPNCRLIALDERINLYQAWNLGWSEARAPLVCISNVDDSMHPKLLDLVVGEMKSNQWDVATVLTAKQGMSDVLNDWFPARIAKLPLSKRPGSFIAWNKSIDARMGRFDESLKIVGDKDFWARAEYHGLALGLIRKIAYLSTHHAEQLSKSGQAKQIKDAERRSCALKDYPHVWPSSIYARMRRYSILSSIPAVKSFFIFR